MSPERDRPSSDRPTAGQEGPGGGQLPAGTFACAACLARSKLLGVLSVHIERASREPSRLLDLLALPDRELIAAIGGRRRQELADRHRALLAETQESTSARSAETRSARTCAVCVHSPSHRQLFGDRLPLTGALQIFGALEHLERAQAGQVVAIVGTSKASDYGMEMAAGLARGLAASGVSVISSFTAGVGAAAHLGVLEAGAPPLAAMPGGAELPQPVGLTGLLRRVAANGAAISELPPGFPQRRWSERACERIVAALADLVVVIEADLGETGMLAASLAADSGVPVAAMPGRITSPASRGPHALLRDGAKLLLRVEDALELLHHTGLARPKNHRLGLTPEAISLLERVGVGEDTLQGICLGPTRQETLAALGELRCRGLLARGDGGRYLPRVSLDLGQIAAPRSVADRDRPPPNAA